MLAVLACVAAPPVSGPTHGDARGAVGLGEDAGPRILPEGAVDVPARPLEPLRPAYPPGLRALGLEGVVEARVAVLADGSVGAAQLVESSHDAFLAATREALHGARFAPARRDGRPVASWVTLRVRFRLDEP